jgi:hypothetical protein
MLMKNFNSTYHDAVFEALHELVQNNHKDPKAALIFTAAGGGVVVQFVYDGPSPPNGAWGSKFEKLLAEKQGGLKVPYPTIVSQIRPHSSCKMLTSKRSG